MPLKEFYIGRSQLEFPITLLEFQFIYPSSHNMALRSTQPLTEMSTGNLQGDKGRPTLKADNHTDICLQNVGTSTSNDAIGPHNLLQG
jgi:hypothetical protein